MYILRNKLIKYQSNLFNMCNSHPPDNKRIIVSLTVQLDGYVTVCIRFSCVGGPISVTLVLSALHLMLQLLLVEELLNGLKNKLVNK